MQKRINLLWFILFAAVLLGQAVAAYALTPAAMPKELIRQCRTFYLRSIAFVSRAQKLDPNQALFLRGQSLAEQLDWRLVRQETDQLYAVFQMQMDPEIQMQLSELMALYNQNGGCEYQYYRMLQTLAKIWQVTTPQIDLYVHLWQIRNQLDVRALPEFSL